jgi:hypothetical protein
MHSYNPASFMSVRGPKNIGKNETLGTLESKRRGNNQQPPPNKSFIETHGRAASVVRIRQTDTAEWKSELKLVSRHAMYK